MRSMMDNAEAVDRFIKDGRIDQALLFLASSLLEAEISDEIDKSEIYYLFGNVYRKKGDFHLAIDYYTLAIEENPDSPAVEARKVLHGIMNFYNKDMYNH